jgi:hypothetical protein
MTRILFLPLKAEYFDAIVAGTKPLEFRAATPYWVKRIEGRTFDLIEITKGYPALGDTIRRNRRVWRGYVRDTITHEHFGNVPTDVFAIDVSMPAPGQPTAKES